MGEAKELNVEGHWADRQNVKSKEYFDKSNKDRDFHSVEPYQGGTHHSERRHRKAIEDAWNNTDKVLEATFSDKYI